MNASEHPFCTAFQEAVAIASGHLAQVAVQAKAAMEAEPQATILVFDDQTGEQVEVDFRGTAEDVRARVEARTFPEPDPAPVPGDQKAGRGPGRPKLGVVSREVTLLPRHWEWLNDRPGGASVALRKLVEEAKRASVEKDQVRKSREVCYTFISAMAGNLPGVEEATRALFAGNRAGFEEHTRAWPVDVREYALKISVAAFEDPSPEKAG